MHAVRIAGLAAMSLLISAAYVEGAATVTLTVPSAQTVPLGGNASYAVTVALTASGFVCAPGPSTATVTLALADPTPVTGIEGRLSTTSVVFPIGAPIAHTSANPYIGAPQTVYVNTTVARNALPTHDHAFNLTATFSAAGFSGCTTAPTGDTYDASDAKSVALTTGAGVGGNGTATGTGTGTSTMATTTEASPSLPMAFNVAILLGIALAAIRRKA